MSNKKVMSHDPLAEVDAAMMGDVQAIPSGLPTGQAPEVSPQADVLVLPDCLTIAEVGDFYPHLVEYLEGGGPLSIDASAVDTIDGAGLQLLAAFVQDLGDKSDGITWIAVSNVMRRSADRMGISSALRLEYVNPGA